MKKNTIKCVEIISSVIVMLLVVTFHFLSVMVYIDNCNKLILVVYLFGVRVPINLLVDLLLYLIISLQFTIIIIVILKEA